tara:strand:+ start:3887 stop:4321 length:435 start_codon:yes stop_codon:yes gene_type:complete
MERRTRITNIQKFNFERIAKNLQKDNALLRTRLRDEKFLLHQVVEQNEITINKLKSRYNIFLLIMFDTIVVIYLYYTNEVFQNFCILMQVLVKFYITKMIEYISSTMNVALIEYQTQIPIVQNLLIEYKEKIHSLVTNIVANFY